MVRCVDKRVAFFELIIEEIQSGQTANDSSC